MKKVRSKIVTSIVLCAVLISVIVGVTSILKSSSIIKNEAKDKLLNMASSRGNEYAIQTSKVESTVNELATIILNNIDVTKVKDDNYLSNYEKELGNILKGLGDRLKCNEVLVLTKETSSSSEKLQNEILKFKI